MSKTWLVFWTLAVSVCAGLIPAGADQARPANRVVDGPPVHSVNRIDAALDLYARGAYDEGMAALRGKAPLRDTVSDFRSRVARWADADPLLGTHRRGVAMAVTVELVAAGVAGRSDEYAAARPLIEWMCATIRRYPPSEAERLFHLATVGLLQGARDIVGLIGLDAHLGARNGHIFHAGDRFPHESRFALALMLTRPEMMAIGTRPVGRNIPLEGPARSYLQASQPAAVLQDTVKRLTALASDPAVGPEVTLRRGVLRFLTGAPDATADFQDAAQSDEPFVRYLSHLMLGITYERSGEARSAIGAYSLAVRTTPGTAASMSLASLLYREGQQDEAAQVADEWSRRPQTTDPWRQFQYGDYRLVPDVLARLRTTR